MWENQENNDNAELSDSVMSAIQAEDAEVVAPKPTYEELELKLATAERNRDYNLNTATRHFDKLSKVTNQVAELETYLRENWESLDAHAEEIADLFDLEMTSTKTFTFTVDVEIEVTAVSPAYDWSNFDGSEIDLDVSASVSYHSRTELDDATVESTDVRECEEN
jgi:hypothetical protein